MTTHPHPMAAGLRSPAAAAKPTPVWLWPALIGIPLVGALLVFGVITPTILLYAGLIGGCALMHVFGHGSHGGAGHESQGAGDDDRPTDSRGADLSFRSSRSQSTDAGSTSKLDDRASNDTANETEHDDQYGRHGCH